MRRPSPRAALFWFGLAVSAVFAYLAVRDVHPGQVWDALRACDYWWLAPALAVLLVANLLRACRWRFLFGAQTRPPFRPVLGAMLIGLLFNNVLPARAGEAARVVVLNQSSGVSRAETIGTIVIERAYDVLSLLVLLFVLEPWLPQVSWLHAAAILAIVLASALGSLFVVVAVWGERPARFLLRPLARLPFVSQERTEVAAANLVQGLAGLRRARLAAAAMVLTTLSWMAIGISSWFVLRGFDLGRDLSPITGVLVVIAIGLALILPSSPAAVGVYEAAVLVALSAYGIPESRALSYALVLHALNFFPYLAFGVLALHLHATGLGRRPVGRVAARAPR